MVQRCVVIVMLCVVGRDGAAMCCHCDALCRRT